MLCVGEVGVNTAFACRIAIFINNFCCDVYRFDLFPMMVVILL
ncbi:hypothetical protein Ark11_0106 [Candidatus Ichthyocystis hellenicum]|uniref:Uncharacterized protein n=1 Tax=Candidatus Ichthyocystis hellenicum TaxID=1561003 RepID=A0A0S4LZH4_9BURK|nr:hypothetical protein Ark11_0106 [Candidatus Ichthyocystis hellenicum]